MVTFAAEIPSNAPLVVRSKASTKVLYAFLLAAATLQLALVALIVWLADFLGSQVLLILLAPLLLQALFLVPIIREYQGLLGPQLAADHTGIWIRTGLGRRPEVVYLPWTAIDGIDTTRKGPVVRILSRHGETLFTQKTHWRVRSLRRRFGTAFIIDGRRSAEPPDQIAHRLWQWAAQSRTAG